jgi:hypothetical protein
MAVVAFLMPAAVSCSSVDEFLEHAGDVAKDVGDVATDVARDVVDEAKQHIPSDQSGSVTVVRPPRPTGKISTGPVTPLASKVVDASGGTVLVQKPGDPLDGMEIQVPPGSYPDSKQFEVSSAPVDGHTFGEYFTPATPLINIENGGDYSEEFMTVRIPLDIPPDHFAMAFYYDEATGTLEGIPFNAVDEHSITIVTRHFCSLLVSIIRNTVLDDLMKSDIDSHFRPGIDDWQFTNYGSYIAKGGHCAGQSISAMWYFCEQPDGQDLTLNGRYDNNGNHPGTPGLWEDDSHGYRLASTVQCDVDFDSFSTKLQVSLRGADDELQFKAFAYAIQITGEPQYAGITSNAGGGHAMVAYRVHDNNIYIADPNYPGNTERRIEYSNGTFKPYNSGANADEIAAGKGKAYENIGYMAKSSAIDWNSIGVRWNEFKAGTIGNDRFPQYQVDVVIDGNKKEPLVDGYESQHKKIEIEVNAAFPVVWDIYRNGTKIGQDADWKYELEDGNNLIGVAVWGDVNNNPQARKWKYVDFQYFNIVYGEKEPPSTSLPYVAIFCGGSMGDVYDSWREERNYSGPSAWSYLGIEGQNGSEIPITWNGLNFSGSATLQPLAGMSGRGSVVVSGSLSRSPSATEPTLLTLNYTETYDATGYDWHNVGLTSYTITNIPLDCNPFNLAPGHELRAIFAESSGVAMQKYLTSLEYRLDTTWLGDEPSLFPDEHWTYTDTTCSAVPQTGGFQTEFTIILLTPETWFK